ncbi:conjugal transfer protein TrbL [Microbacterium keratanolyticum]
MSLCDIPVVSTVCETLPDTLATALTLPFDWMGQAAANTAQWMFETVWMLIDSTTLVDVTTPEYVRVYNILFGIGIFVMLIFFFLQLSTGVLRRDPGALKHGLIGLGRAILGGFLVIGLVGTLLEITDQLTIGIVHASGNTMATLGDKLALLSIGMTPLNVTAPGVSAILMIFLGFIGIAAAAILWFSLLIRKALLLAAIVLAPLALSGTVWEHTKGWASKWIAFVVALVISKLVVVVIFLVATAQLAAPIDLDIAAIADPVSGIVLLLVAGFAPYMCYKLVSFIGFDMYQAMSVEQEAKQAANRPLPVPSWPKSGDSTPKVLDEGGKGTPPPGDAPHGTASPTVGESSGGTGAGAEAGAAGGGAGTGGAGSGAAAGGGSAGAAAGGGAAAAGPAAAVIVGAQVAKEVVTAGPKAGAFVGAQADQHADSSQAAPSSSPTQAGTPAPSRAGQAGVADPTLPARKE